MPDDMNSDDMNSDDMNFADFIGRERDRLYGEREQLFSEQTALHEKLRAISAELAAIDAYEAAKRGKAAAAPARQFRRAPTARRHGSRREDLVRLIGNEPGGLSRGDILTRLGLKGDKSREMSISNALTALTKNQQVIRQDGKYRLPA